MKQKIIVYGLGNDFDEQEGFIRERFDVAGVSDSDPRKGLQYSDFIMKQDIHKVSFEKLLICSEKYYEEIRRDLIASGIDSRQIVGMQGNVYSLSGREPIIVVGLSGGMGNLMFQYALVQRLMVQCPKTKVKVDLSWYQMEQNLSFFKVLYIFESIFHIKLPVATKEEVAESKRQNQFKECQRGTFQTEIEKISAGYIDGYWQTAKYFENISEQVKKSYTFNLRYLSDRQKRVLEQINSGSNTAAVWIRRGDYVDKYADIYGGICTEEYYQNAMNYLLKKYGDVDFFVFSNDPEYVKEKYSEYPCVVYPSESTEICDYSIYLMSLCNHLIIANSTFSWWAAWLKGEYGTVICPKKWINSFPMPDILEESWIKI